MSDLVLNNKPLAEAILEVRWDLRVGANGLPEDDLYDIMIGSFHGSLKEILPVRVRLPSAVVMGMNLPYQVQHQFRTAADKWPLVQIGPGVLTINETEGYRSSSFLRICQKVIEILFGFWKENNRRPELSHVALRYINADAQEKNLLDFLNKTGINLDFDQRLVSGEKFREKNPKEVRFFSAFDIEEPRGTFSISANPGAVNGIEATVWEMQVDSTGDQCTFFVNSTSDWLKSANEICHDFFFSMIEHNLLERYK